MSHVKLLLNGLFRGRLYLSTHGYRKGATHLLHQSRNKIDSMRQRTDGRRAQKERLPIPSLYTISASKGKLYSHLFRFFLSKPPETQIERIRGINKLSFEET
jgi:hypothetical protein